MRKKWHGIVGGPKKHCLTPKLHKDLFGGVSSTKLKRKVQKPLSSANCCRFIKAGGAVQKDEDGLENARQVAFACFFKHSRRYALGTSKNAVMTQIWIAMVAMLLLTYYKFMAKLNYSLSQVFNLLQLSLFNRQRLWQMMDKGKITERFLIKMPGQSC